MRIPIILIHSVLHFSSTYNIANIQNLQQISNFRNKTLASLKNAKF
jgi:hypothetical protein